MTPSKRRPILVFAGAVLIVLVLTAGVGSTYVTRPAPDLATGVVDIRRGWGASEIARAIFPQSRARQVVFRSYVTLRGAGRKLKAGEYLLERDSIRSFVKKLVAGQVLQYRVTVAEGTWAADVTLLLDSAQLGRRERFMELILDRAFVRKVTGTDAASLEGFLFPETYYFTRGMTEEDILKTFVARFNEMARPHLENGRMPFADALTLASIVEREAAAREERPMIAAVFLNRLKKRMNLESCVTVEYALGRKKKHLYEEDLRVDSPYNTYRHPGLPPGPVCNPGLAAIHAVVEPADTTYLFFVARGDGRHIFSTTLAEHLRAKKRLKKS